jgi:purine-cytosine permease-like protein
VTPEVRRTDPEGVDYGWVMQVTFIVTIVVGAPVVAGLSMLASLPTWSDRAVFVVRAGAPVWLVTAVSVYAYARRQQRSEDVEPE